MRYLVKNKAGEMVGISDVEPDVEFLKLVDDEYIPIPDDEDVTDAIPGDFGDDGRLSPAGKQRIANFQKALKVQRSMSVPEILEALLEGDTAKIQKLRDKVREVKK